MYMWSVEYENTEHEMLGLLDTQFGQYKGKVSMVTTHSWGAKEDIK